MKQFDTVHVTPDDRGRRGPPAAVDLNLLKRRTRKRVQLEYRKLRAEPLRHLLCKLFSLYVGAVALVMLCNMFFNGSHPIGTVTLTPQPRHVSVVVPTYQEVDNIGPLCRRVFQATKQAEIEAELIIVDDNSQDGTLDAVLGLQSQYDITLVVRKKARGLSSAVLAGFAQAKYDVMLVLDADLSHPPEVIPNLVQPIFDGTADLVLGSRHVAGGGTDGWPLSRKIISAGAKVLAYPVADVHDPMSGFFAISKRLYLQGQSQLNPTGFKIALELLVKTEPEKALEVPYVFVDRTAGQSKLKLKTQAQYLVQVLRLYWFAFPWTCLLLLALTCAFLYLLAKVCLPAEPGLPSHVDRGTGPGHTPTETRTSPSWTF